MTLLDKTYCASPDCKNECGRQMTDEEHNRIKEYISCGHSLGRMAYAYFCNEPNEIDKLPHMSELEGIR